MIRFSWFGSRVWGGAGSGRVGSALSQVVYSRVVLAASDVSHLASRAISRSQTFALSWHARNHALRIARSVRVACPRACVPGSRVAAAFAFSDRALPKVSFLSAFRGSRVPACRNACRAAFPPHVCGETCVPRPAFRHACRIAAFCVACRGRTKVQRRERTHERQCHRWARRPAFSSPTSCFEDSVSGGSGAEGRFTEVFLRGVADPPA